MNLDPWTLNIFGGGFNKCIHDLNSIRWDPPALEQVPDDMVENYFSPLGEFEPELKLPTNLREAFI